jgi:hypothetical protein
MKLFKSFILILLATQLSFADLNYNSTLGTNDRNSGPKVAVALVVSAAVLWVAYWFWGGGKDQHDIDKVGDIKYTDRTEEIKK